MVGKNEFWCSADLHHLAIPNPPNNPRFYQLFRVQNVIPSVSEKLPCFQCLISLTWQDHQYWKEYKKFYQRNDFLISQEIRGNLNSGYENEFLHVSHFFINSKKLIQVNIQPPLVFYLANCYLGDQSMLFRRFFWLLNSYSWPFHINNTLAS